MGYSPDDLKSIDRLIDLFESWMAKHGKIYKSLEEKLRRFEVFRDNLEHIDDRNKKIVNYWLGLNEFADLSHEEFKKMHLGLKVELPKIRGSPEEFIYRDVVDLPKSVDWRKKGAVTPVKNQGSCGRYIQCQHNAVYLIYQLNELYNFKYTRPKATRPEKLPVIKTSYICFGLWCIIMG